jgi:hypothetical protein
MVLTTLLGRAQLMVQNAMTSGLTVVDGVPRVPNDIVVSLRRESFLQQYHGALTEERERFRRELHEGVRAFLASHGWRVGGTGSIVINVLLRAITEECVVQVRTVDRLFDLLITDSGGSRTVPVRYSPATVGRAHDSHTRGFIPVQDESRLLSREHLHLTYSDLVLTMRLLGRNPTTLNGEAVGTAEVELHRGDLIACGRCTIEIGEIL